MRELGLRGVVRGKPKYTRAVPADAADRPRDLVDPPLQHAGAPNPALGRRPDLHPRLDRLRVRRVHHRRLLADGGCAGKPPGRCAPTSPSTPWSRRSGLAPAAVAGFDELVHRSDRGVQYLAIRYTKRLAETGAVNSVGSKGDSYDNALAETMIGLYKAELVETAAPGAASTTSSTPLGMGRLVQPPPPLRSPRPDPPPAEFEENCSVRKAQASRPRLKPNSLHETRSGIPDRLGPAA